MHKPEIILDENHRYTVDGFPVMGVSEIIADNGFGISEKVPQRVLEVASKFGSFTHKATQLHDLKTLDKATLSSEIEAYLNGWIKFREDFGFDPSAIELRGYSKIHNYCFTLDRAGLIKKGLYAGEMAVVDIKTSTGIQKSTAIQLDGYMIGYNESWKPRATKGLSVQLLPDDYKVQFNEPHDTGIFIACARLSNWRKIK